MYIYLVHLIKVLYELLSSLGVVPPFVCKLFTSPQNPLGLFLCRDVYKSSFSTYRLNYQLLTYSSFKLLCELQLVCFGRCYTKFIVSFWRNAWSTPVHVIMFLIFYLKQKMFQGDNTIGNRLNVYIIFSSLNNKGLYELLSSLGVVLSFVCKLFTYQSSPQNQRVLLLCMNDV